MASKLKKEYKVKHIFIASPGGLEKERELFPEILGRVNKNKAHNLGIHLEPLGWEDTLLGRGRPQGLINEDVEDCDLFVMLLWTRWGTPTGKYTSGCEEEFELAKKLGKEIWLYFRSIPQAMLADPGEQLKKVLDFRKKIEGEREFLFINYENPDDWVKKFESNLCKWLDKQPLTSSSLPPNLKEDPEVKSLIKKLSRENIKLKKMQETTQSKLRSHAINLGSKAWEKANEGELTVSEELFAKSVEMYPETYVLQLFGRFSLRIGNLKRAEKLFIQCKEIGEKIKDKKIVADAYTSLGNVYQTQGDLKKAEEMHGKALVIHEELGHKEGMAADYGNLGNVYQTQGDLKKAEEMHGKALVMDEELGHKEGMAADYNNLGVVYQTQGDLKKAKDMYERALEMFISLGNISMINKTKSLIDDLKSKKQ